MSKIKALAGETVLYGLGNIVPRMLNFILFPIHTAFFQPEQFGVLTYLMSWVAFLNIIYSFGMETAYFRFVSKEGADKQKVFNLAQTITFSVSTFLSLLFILFRDFWAVKVGIPHHPEWIVWLAVILWTDNITSIPFAKLRQEKKALQFALFRVINIALLIGLTYLFLYILYRPEVGIGYIILANLIANSFYLLFFYRDWLSWRPAWDSLISPHMFRYAYPVMLMGIPGMINEQYSRIALETWLPDNFYPGKTKLFALGIFGACYKFSVFINLTISAFRLAAEPFFFSNATDAKSPALFARVNHYFVIVLCAMFIFISINLSVIVSVLHINQAYWQGLSIVPPLLLGFVFLGIYYNLTAWFKLTDKTYFGTFITLGGAVLTMLLNWLLIPHYGYEGSSWVTPLVYGSMMITCYLLGQHYFPIPYKVREGVLYILLSVAWVYAVRWMSGYHVSFLVLANMCTFIFLFLLYRSERKRIWG